MTKSVTITQDQRVTFICELADRITAPRLAALRGEGVSCLKHVADTCCRLYDVAVALYSDAQEMNELYTLEANRPVVPWSSNYQNAGNIHIGNERNGTWLFGMMTKSGAEDHNGILASIGGRHLQNQPSEIQQLIKKLPKLRWPLGLRDRWSHNDDAYEFPASVQKFKSRAARIMVPKEKAAYAKGRDTKAVEALLAGLYKDALNSNKVWEEAAVFAKETQEMLKSVRNTGALENKYPELYEAWCEIMGSANTTTCLVPVADVAHVNNMLRGYKRSK